MNCVPMPADGLPGELTDDAVLGGRLRLLQPRRGHRFGHDAILLAAATAARSGEHAVDLGAGVGAAGLVLASRVAGLSVILVEIDATLAALAKENAERNGLADRVSVVVLDVAAPARAFAATGLTPGSAERVMMNPPFNDPVRQQASPDKNRRRAHAAPREALAVWVKTAFRLLRPKGVLTLIFPASRMADVLGALGRGFGAVTLLPVHPKPGAAAIRILVRAVKGSGAPLAILPGFVLNGDDGRPSPQAEAVLREGTLLALAETC